MNDQMIKATREKNISVLSKLYEQYGIDEKSLGWTKNKQHLRFEQMLSGFDINNTSILDVGCGFGDLYEHLMKTRPDAVFDYTGIDIMSDFIDVAKNRYPELSFYNTDLFSYETGKKYKYVINCGCLTFLDTNNEDESYEFINGFISKNLELCEDDGVSIIHFLTDKVDYRTSTEDFHISPERILSIAYSHSRRVVLDNSIFPFEACLFIYKDDSFRKENTTFIRAGL